MSESRGQWTIDTLHDHIMGQVCSVDRRHTELAAARDKAVDVAIKAADEKAKTHNDLLGAMKEQQATFPTKEQVDLQHKAVMQRIDALEKHQVADTAKDKTLGLTWAAVVQLLTAATLIIAIVVFFANR